MALAVVVVGGVVAGVAVGLGRSDNGKDNSGSGLPPNTATVTKQTLLDTTTEAGELGYGITTAVGARREGTITALPAVGDTIARGERLYAIDGVPVVLLYGSIPAYRALKTGDEGADVEQLEKNLAALGYVGFDGDEGFTANTANAVKRWQKALGVEQTGTIELGSVAFAPTKIRVAALSAGKGDVATPGLQVLSYSGNDKAVSLELEPEALNLVKKGTKVTVSLPNGTSLGGVVEGVSTRVKPGQGEEADTTTVEVQVALKGEQAQKAAEPYALAAVNVVFTTDKREDVLAVPVAALVALQEGGFGVEVVKDGTSSYVAVKTGLFADGKVEVSGEGIAEATKVGMPK